MYKTDNYKLQSHMYRAKRNPSCWSHNVPTFNDPLFHPFDHFLRESLKVNS